MFKISSGFSISTHTPPARRDIQGVMDTIESTGFLLTRLPRGVTRLDQMEANRQAISTHTPPARRDAVAREFLHWAKDFYSHASREA